MLKCDEGRTDGRRENVQEALLRGENGWRGHWTARRYINHTTHRMAGHRAHSRNDAVHGHAVHLQTLYITGLWQTRTDVVASMHQVTVIRISPFDTQHRSYRIPHQLNRLFTAQDWQNQQICASATSDFYETTSGILRFSPAPHYGKSKTG